ncbi:MAG: hypothetical protein C5B50_12965 [Verrucomicrobia bacterium]|nr:MAG: hypothetical protein C5B50_12965 [Verrucomicrobiota bacterium]
MLNFLVGLLAVLSGASVGCAQQRFQLTFYGVFSTTNAAGAQIVTTGVNTRTLLREFARSYYLTNANSLTLAYHVNGALAGDTIEVIDAKTGNFVGPLYGLYEGDLYGRMPLVSSDGTQIKRLEYVYSQQDGWPVGSGIITERFFLGANGNTNRTLIQGQIQFLTLPDPAHKLGFYSGTFITGRPIPGTGQ